MCKHTEAIITKGKAVADIDLELSRGGGGERGEGEREWGEGGSPKSVTF